MWQLWGTVAVSSLGGSLLLHYFKNFLLEEKMPLAWDWDGIFERGLITYIIAAQQTRLYLIPVVILLKIMLRLILLRVPAPVSQKIVIKAELGFDLIVSPAFAILVGVVF
jgi:hypothetical protein